MENQERARRWRLALGGEGSAPSAGAALSEQDGAIDAALNALYGGGEGVEKDNRRVGMGPSSPKVARWLGDIRRFFPASVVRVMQTDAMERLGLRQMLLEPEMMQAVEPDVHMVATLLSLKNVMPATSLETARRVVQRVVDDLQRRLEAPLRQAVIGSLSRSERNNRPRHSEIDWNRTIRANLKHYQPELNTIVPERRIGYGRRRQALREIILCVDQSGSMATSVVYAGIFGSVLASLPALKTHVVVYDTSVVDLTENLDDPVEILFGTQLGGGNDTPRALDYCKGLISRPSDTIFILISDLYEGAGGEKMVRQLSEFAAAGVQVITLLALSDDGKPSYEPGNAQSIAAFAPVFACTPDLFPELMAAAISRSDLNAWAASNDIVAARGSGSA